MTMAFRGLLALLLVLMILDLICSLEQNFRDEDKTPEDDFIKFRARHLLSHAENATIDIFKDIHQRLRSGERDILSRKRTGRQYIEYSTFGPMLDGILFGDFCSRPIYQAVAGACSNVLNYQVSQSSAEATPAQMASNLTSTVTSTKNTYVISLASTGKVSFTSLQRAHAYRQCAFTIFRQNNQAFNVECHVPSNMNGNGVFKIIQQERDASRTGGWQTVYTDSYDFYRTSITILMLDNGDFVGTMDCSWIV